MSERDFLFDSMDIGLDKSHCGFCERTIRLGEAYEYTWKFIISAYDFYQKYMAVDDHESSEKQKSPFYDDQLC